MIVACPSCVKRLNVPDEAAGQTGQCPWCKSPFRLPAPKPLAAPATPAVVTVPPIAAIPVPAMAPLTVEPIALRGDGTLYPLAADPQVDPEIQRDNAQILKEAARTADAERRRRKAARRSDLVWSAGRSI
jgi:hypothetical protein